MRLAVLSLAFCLLPSLALAAGWTAQMEEDEGGPTMVASVTGEGGGDYPPMLRMMCGGEDINLRFEMGTDAGEPGSEADFLFENEHDQVKLHMALEEMDGAFAAYFPATDPIIALLETGKDVFISETAGNYPAQSFSLAGSTKAIGKLLKSCN